MWDTEYSEELSVPVPDLYPELSDSLPNMQGSGTVQGDMAKGVHSYSFVYILRTCILMYPFALAFVYLLIQPVSYSCSQDPKRGKGESPDTWSPECFSLDPHSSKRQRLETRALKMPCFFGLGAPEPCFFEPGAWSPKTFWDPV